MKNRFLLSVSFLALVTGMVAISGCKDTATDPTYVALAEIRFADYHQIDPLQFYLYPQNTTSADSATKTPTALTYGIVTGYINNLQTNRTAGMKYHLVAKYAGTDRVAASEDITLMPGDKKTWLITGNGSVQGGHFDTKVIEDNPPANQPTDVAYFRFLNVTPANPSLDLIVGDPISGKHVATGVKYQETSAYVGLSVARDTTLTFYVVDNSSGTPIVLSRLAGVGLAAGTYHTMTWGGEAPGFRIPDATTGTLTLNDTVRIRILDDDPGTDLTVTAPLTFRYNVINALIPPSFPTAGVVDYTTGNANGTKGLSIILNNNTVYDYQNLMPFSLAPGAFNTSSEGVFSVVPATTNMVDKLYFEFVQPAFKNPSSADKMLFRFFAGSPRSSIKSDQLYAVVVFDTVQVETGPKASLVGAGYDSSKGVFTVPIPDIPIAGAARIVLGYFPAPPLPPKKGTANNGAKFYITMNGTDSLITTTKNKLGTLTKTFDSSIVVPAGQQITLKCTLATFGDVPFTFTPESGAIYEAFFVGQRGREQDDNGKPRFMVVKVNP